MELANSEEVSGKSNINSCSSQVTNPSEDSRSTIYSEDEYSESISEDDVPTNLPPKDKKLTGSSKSPVLDIIELPEGKNVNFCRIQVTDPSEDSGSTVYSETEYSESISEDVVATNLPPKKKIRTGSSKSSILGIFELPEKSNVNPFCTQDTNPSEDSESTKHSVTACNKSISGDDEVQMEESNCMSTTQKVVTLKRLSQSNETSSEASQSSSSNLLDFIRESNLSSHLVQYRLTYVEYPSDDSDFEDMSYETMIEYETYKENEKKSIAEAEFKNNENRIEIFRNYFDSRKNKMKSVFNLKGLKFSHFSSKFIRMIFTPSTLSQVYILPNKKNYVSFSYKKDWWKLQRYDVPNRSEVLEIFNRFVVDKMLMKIIFKIHNSLVKATTKIIQARKEKRLKFVMGMDVEMNSDEEKLFLPSQSRINKMGRFNKVLKRALPFESKLKSDC